MDKSFWIKIKLYSAQFLLSWCTRQWQFASGLFFVILSPNENLRLTSINQFLLLSVLMFLIPIVGKWIDSSKRIHAMRASIFIDNTLVFLCCVAIYWVDEQQDGKEIDSLVLGLLTLSLLLCCLEGVANVASNIALQRDWIIVLCDAGHADLRTLNTVLKQIDLLCNVVAPILTGYLMTSQGTQITAIVLAGTFAIFAAVSTALLTSVYNDEPSLAQPKMNSYGEKATLMGKPYWKGKSRRSTNDSQSVTHRSFESSSGIKLESYESVEGISPADNQGKCDNCNIFRIFRDGFQIYQYYPVKWAAFSLAMLFLTTLSIHYATSGYLLLHGMTETSIAIVTAASSISGCLGTYLYFHLEKKVGLERGALYGILIQLMSITISMVALWLPYVQSDHAFSCAKLGVGDSQDCSGFATLVVFCLGIVLSRAGLWTFDLSVVQMIQESVPAAVRGRFNGFQHALQSAFEVKQIILVILFPEVSTYRWLGLVSYISVLSAFFVYLYYYLNTRKENRRSQTSDPIEDAS